MGGQHHEVWQTAHELDFLCKLGTWGMDAGGPGAASRKALLMRYLRASRRRVDWGAIQREIVLDEARLMWEEEA